MSCGKECNCATYRDHLVGISFSAHAMPNRKPSLRTVRVDNDDKAFEKDGVAYKALRRQGYQPKDVDGCAELQQRARTEAEITTGRILDDSQHRQVKALTGQVHEVMASANG